MPKRAEEKAEAWWEDAPAYRDEVYKLAKRGWTLERLALLTPVEVMELIEKDDELKAEKIVFWARQRSGVMAPGPPKPR
ncbi:MAG: hypothetical protein JZD41_01535, partial [Thermoproteus sp.]|nr:hypothetical protein [Thermoproteus sp.]